MKHETDNGGPLLLATGKLDPHQARLELLAGIERGEKAIDAGRVLTHEAARKRMARWLGNLDGVD